MNYIVIEYSSNRRSSIFNSVMTQQDSCEQNIHKKRYMPCILFNQCFGDGHAELIPILQLNRHVPCTRYLALAFKQCNGRAGPSMTDMFTYFSL